MKLHAITGLLLILSMGDAATAAPAGPALLWQGGNNLIRTVKCAENIGDIDEHCLAIEIATDTGRSIVGERFAWANLLWSKKPGQKGPDVLVLGDMGGSGGSSDLIAVSFSPRLAVWKLHVAPGDSVAIAPGKNPLCLTFPFGVRINGASNADTTFVQIPLCWSSGAFVLDRKALLARSFPIEDLRFRELAIRYELGRWASDSYPANDFYPLKTSSGTPVTVRALLDLMLTGHADVARAMLHENWPRNHENVPAPMGGEKHFWGTLCRVIVGHDDWTGFHLDQIPHAKLIEDGAKMAEN